MRIWSQSLSLHAAGPLLRHDVVLYNYFTVDYIRSVKTTVPSAVSYQGTGCMVQPLPGDKNWGDKEYEIIEELVLKPLKSE